MRATTVLAISLALVALFPAAASASHDPTGAPFGQDFAVGSGAQSGLGTFEFDARSGPRGENPTGTALIDFEVGLVASGPVSCLTVAGHRAAFIFEPVLFPFRLRIDVEDNQGTAPDAMRVEQAGADTTCPVPTFPQGTAISSGDIVVHDAPALPTSATQCKDGGWKSYGVFKNQGDCVSFVATKGKNQPSGT